MIDRTTKTLLLAIAVGLWLHVASDWLRPTPVQAQRGDTSLLLLSDIERHTKNIAADTSSMAISLSRPK
jgi:hypothetical protein